MTSPAWYCDDSFTIQLMGVSALKENYRVLMAPLSLFCVNWRRSYSFQCYSLFTCWLPAHPHPTPLASPFELLMLASSTQYYLGDALEASYIAV